MERKRRGPRPRWTIEAPGGDRERFRHLKSARARLNGLADAPGLAHLRRIRRGVYLWWPPVKEYPPTLLGPWLVYNLVGQAWVHAKDQIELPMDQADDKVIRGDADARV
jgi:hypothetical protein